MSNLRNLFQSAGYQAFMKKILWYSLIVIVLGFIFWLMHWPGGEIMLTAGGGCLIIWLVFFIIEKLF
jgi:hypothetical protein